MTDRSDQPSLFSAAELRASKSWGKTEATTIGCEALQNWKQRIWRYQQQVLAVPPNQQGALFDWVQPAIVDQIDRLNPFTLPQQNTEFWRWKASDAGQAAFYFVIDYELPILLYVGETVKSNQRWKGEHDCKRYLLNYISAHRLHQLTVAVNTAFWVGAPEATRSRQQLESDLISKWRSPFNKENWNFWGTPFVGGK